MKSKYKIGNKVSFMFDGKRYYGKIYIIDFIRDMEHDWRYDVMCSKPEKVLVKHIFEENIRGEKWKH